MTAPAEGGTYILLIECPSADSIEIGRLGKTTLEAGVYAYVGSAFGPGGLAARVRRYLVGARRTHWHIDYLLAHASVRGALVNTEGRKLECSWSAWFEGRSQACIAGFGASDCHCSSHLYRLGTESEADGLIRTAVCELNATYLDRRHLGNG